MSSSFIINIKAPVQVYTTKWMEDAVKQSTSLLETTIIISCEMIAIVNDLCR